MSIEETNKVSLGKFPWDGIATFFGTVSGLSFFLSLVFDMGYFSTLGLSFADVPTSISDHVRSALLWVPQAVAATFGYAVLTLLQWMFADVVMQHEKSSDKGISKTTSIVLRRINRGLFYAAFAVFWIDLLSGGSLGKYGAAAAPIVVLYIIWDIASRAPITKRLSPATKIAAIGFIAAPLLVFYTGVGQAIEEREHPRRATITVDGPKELHIAVHRFLDRGILASDEHGQYFFYRWDDIKGVRTSFHAPRRTNWLCKSTGITCTLINQPVAPSTEQ